VKWFIAALILTPSGLWAGEWRDLSGSEIEAALTDRDLVYENATQRFYASGRTLYNAGQDSWGYWAVRGDQYCSQWPPSDGWDCYAMAQSGDVLRFLGADGSFTDGTYPD
jgi:hypothetical protein